MAREHLASLIDDIRLRGREIAIVEHRGNRHLRTSYGEIVELAGRFSAELRRRDIAPGERVVLWGQSSAEWVGAFFGCMLRGVLVVPLDASGSADFTRRIVTDTKPRLVLGDAVLIAKLQTDIPKLSLGELRTTVAVEMDLSVDPSVGPDTPFQIVFTSGTASEPKG